MGRSVSTALLWSAKRHRFSEQFGVDYAPCHRRQRVESVETGGGRSALVSTILALPRSRFIGRFLAPNRALDTWPE